MKEQMLNNLASKRPPCKDAREDEKVKSYAQEILIKVSSEEAYYASIAYESYPVDGKRDKMQKQLGNLRETIAHYSKRKEYCYINNGNNNINNNIKDVKHQQLEETEADTQTEVSQQDEKVHSQEEQKKSQGKLAD